MGPQHKPNRKGLPAMDLKTTPCHPKRSQGKRGEKNRLGADNRAHVTLQEGGKTTLERSEATSPPPRPPPSGERTGEGETGPNFDAQARKTEEGGDCNVHRTSESWLTGGSCFEKKHQAALSRKNAHLSVTGRGVTP